MKSVLLLTCTAILFAAPLLAQAQDMQSAGDTQNSAAGTTGDGYDPQANADAARDAASRAQDQSEELDTPGALESSVTARQSARDAQDQADQTSAHDAGMDGPPPLGQSGSSGGEGADSGAQAFDPGTQGAAPVPEPSSPSSSTDGSD